MQHSTEALIIAGVITTVVLMVGLRTMVIFLITAALALSVVGFVDLVNVLERHASTPAQTQNAR
jgi:hypothetical protein